MTPLNVLLGEPRRRDRSKKSVPTLARFGVRTSLT